MYTISKIYSNEEGIWMTQIDCEKEDCIDFTKHTDVIEVRAESKKLVFLRANKIIKTLNKNSLNIVRKAKGDSNC